MKTILIKFYIGSVFLIAASCCKTWDPCMCYEPYFFVTIKDINSQDFNNYYLIKYDSLTGGVVDSAQMTLRERYLNSAEYIFWLTNTEKYFFKIYNNRTGNSQIISRIKYYAKEAPKLCGKCYGNDYYINCRTLSSLSYYADGVFYGRKRSNDPYNLEIQF